MSKFLIALGVVLIIAGLAWPYLGKLGVGRLPGDIVIERVGFTLHLPLTTSILISAVLTLLLWLLWR